MCADEVITLELPIYSSLSSVVSSHTQLGSARSPSFFVSYQNHDVEQMGWPCAGTEQGNVNMNNKIIIRTRKNPP